MFRFLFFIFSFVRFHCEDSHIVCATDAKNPKIRFKFQSVVFEMVKDEMKHLENNITHKGLPCSLDIRFPNRKTYGALSNMETVVLALPFSRSKMRARPRLNYSACAEKTSHSRSYSAVPWRSLSSLPRMALDVKEGVVGVTLPVYPEIVTKEASRKGHPFFLAEVLDVEWYISFFKDLHATRVFDIAAGSGAAACAAAILDIEYEGIAMSSKHAAWLDNIMDKAIFAIVTEREVPRDAQDKPDKEVIQLQDNVKAYFQDLVEEGRKFVVRAEEEEEDDIGDDDDDEGTQS